MQAASVFPVLFSCGLPVLMLAACLRFPPSWAGELRTAWHEVNEYALVASIILVIAAGVLLPPGMSFLAALSVLVPYAAMAYPAVQAAFTDEQLRLADRRLLFGANVVAGSVNLTALYVTGDKQALTFAVALTIAAAVLFAFPGVFGPSDTRALMLTVLGSFPILGLEWYVRALGLMVFLFVAYAFVAALRTSGEDKPGFMKRFLGKVSLPAAPLILLPHVVMIPVAFAFG